MPANLPPDEICAVMMNGELKTATCGIRSPFARWYVRKDLLCKTDDQIIQIIKNSYEYVLNEDMAKIIFVALREAKVV